MLFFIVLAPVFVSILARWAGAVLSLAVLLLLSEVGLLTFFSCLGFLCESQVWNNAVMQYLRCTRHSVYSASFDELSDLQLRNASSAAQHNVVGNIKVY